MQRDTTSADVRAGVAGGGQQACDIRQGHDADMGCANGVSKYIG